MPKASPTATPELLRCNAKVIRPHEQASDGGMERSGQTSSTSVTPPRPDQAFIVADGESIGSEGVMPNAAWTAMPIASWTGQTYSVKDRSCLLRSGSIVPIGGCWHLGVKQRGPDPGFSSLDRPWGKASWVGEPGLPRPDNNPFTG